MRSNLVLCLVLSGVLSPTSLDATRTRSAGAPAQESTSREGTGQQAKKGGRKAPRALTDGWITMKIHASFIGEKALRDSDVDVDTDNRLVTLKGTVRSEAGRRRAVAIARGTEGVGNVVDQLRVERAAPAAGQTRGDDRPTGTAGREADKSAKTVSAGWITSKLSASLLTEPLLDESDIAIDVEDGVVTLSGNVHTTEGRTRAEEIARRTEGVRLVNNQLKVSPVRLR